jgi:hypothetical protein
VRYADMVYNMTAPPHDLEDTIQHGNEENVSRVLAAWPDAQVFDGRMQYMSPGWGRAELPRLACWIKNRARAVGPTTAVEDLQQYLESDRVSCIDVMPVAALQVKDDILLSKGVSIISGGRCLAGTFGGNVIRKAKPFVKEPARLSCIVRNRTYPRIHLDAGEEPDATNPGYPGIQELEDVRLLVTLAAPKAPISLGHWTDYPPHVPAVSPRGGSIHDVRAQAYMAESSADVTLLRTLHGAWVRLGEKSRRRYRISLARLSWAVSRSYRSELGSTAAAQVESAIDIGIALESIFLTNIGPDRGELSFRLRLHAARLLRQDPHERSALARDLRRFYQVRSAAVHAGTIPKGVEGVGAGRLIMHATAVVREALKRIIIDGEPDWHQLVLS